MVGTQEQRLIDIRNAPEWDIPALERLYTNMQTLTDGMVKLTGGIGIAGATGNAALDRFVELRNYFIKVTEELEEIKDIVADANTYRRIALIDLYNLPSTTVPPEIHAAVVAGGAIVVPFWGAVAAEVAVQKYQEVLKAQREEKALEALENFDVNLQPRTARLRATGGPIDPEPVYPVPPVVPEPTPDDGWVNRRAGGGGWNGSVTGTGGGTDGHGNGGGGGGTGGGGTGGGGVGTGGPGIHTSVDGGTTGSSGFGGGGGGAGAGLLGAGLGAGALAAGAKLAGKAPGSLVAGGNLTPGSGGLAGAGTGGRSNSAMMGGGGAGGSGDKEKRASLGLVAPKLEDDDEPIVRSAAAGAGGRDQTPKE